MVNFITRVIPKDFAIKAAKQGFILVNSSQNNPKGSNSLLIGGTANNNFGAALLYFRAHGSDCHEYSATKIDDVILKTRYVPNDIYTFSNLL